ncbi:MAG: hypothetical protein LLG00_03965 [Planctomycetaceae bacterium]|nr:hypothetical protein [Planctomycetaceae bacterium]
MQDSLDNDPNAPPPLVLGEQSVEAAWYTRFDYLSWNEQTDGERLLDEYGTLYTFGYQRRMGSKRGRLELFDAVVHYSGETQDGRQVASTTGYIGARAEGEWICDFDVRPTATTSFVAGLGTRFWLRNMPDATIVGSHGYADGYQETWWTLYPYLGLEKKWLTENGIEIFLSGRIGCTAVTYELSSYERVVVDPVTGRVFVVDPMPLYPKVNMTSEVQCGLRFGRFDVSARFESMAWQKSAVARGMYQPDSRMTTIGLMLGLSF